MVFAHDTERALAAAAALVNTGLADAGDQLTTLAELDELVRTWQWTGPRAGTPAELAAVRELRPTLARFWSGDKDTVVELVNQVLRDRHALPQLVKHDQWDYHVHATAPDAPLADRMAVEAAMAIADVIRIDELGRLRICGGEDCEDVYVDLSKNRSRRFCGATCGNRANVAAYRARRR
ncbi:CGNR zinc finger domain-containing protein [Jatrophihabitans sp.]|uniref:CGNR zinc finger domain-containing protein n=1 Tax=Jatrophihabitans sp. TaxID=1932789 RepID=UPI002C084B49|nr:CGNR zinc finger domain-containing protein [Jatrophihabitans sp.]